MTTRIHPLTGEPINGHARGVNGKPRPELLAALDTLRTNRRSAALSFDAARSGTDLDGHWAFADSLDPDSSYSQDVRHTLAKRSRYEQGSNGIYDGILNTHCNMLVGVGPSLRMLTGNRTFNQLVEREFYKWMQATGLRRKLWAMCHARFGDGETYAILQTNPGLANPVQLDILPIETEQCQTPFGNVDPGGNIDGIHVDEWNNVIAYDILPAHPGSSSLLNSKQPVRVGASAVVHWFKLKRPGAHHGIPDCTSSLNVGASSRRFREATVAAAETAADLAVISSTNQGPAGEDEADPIAPFTGVPLPKRTWLFNPMGWSTTQLDAKHPNASYESFTRNQASETGRPLSMPVNLSLCDSSTYSFASGKLDTICFKLALDVEREDCNECILEPLFAAWFREWTMVADRRDIIPDHQWDWPAHPVIDAVQEATAIDMRLKNGTITLRQVFSDQGQDLEDQLVIMAEDLFGSADDASVLKCRKILALKNCPQHAVNQIETLLAGEETETTAAPLEADVAKTALNGAQVVSLVDIIDRAAKGSIPIGSVAPIIAAAFPGISASQVSAIVDPLAAFKPTPVPGPGAPPASLLEPTGAPA